MIPFLKEISNMIPFFTYGFLNDTTFLFTHWCNIFKLATKPRAMCLLVMAFDGIGMKDNNGAEGTWQLHAQMGVLHMSTDGGMVGQGSLSTPLNLAVVDPLGVTYVDM